MTKSGNKLKATFGFCTECKKFYPFGEYIVAYDQVLCKAHMLEFEENNKEQVKFFKTHAKATYR